MVVVTGKRQTAKGATFRYTLDRRASVVIPVQRRTVRVVYGRA